MGVIQNMVILFYEDPQAEHRTQSTQGQVQNLGMAGEVITSRREE